MQSASWGSRVSKITRSQAPCTQARKHRTETHRRKLSSNRCRCRRSVILGHIRYNAARIILTRYAFAYFKMFYVGSWYKAAKAAFIEEFCLFFLECRNILGRYACLQNFNLMWRVSVPYLRLYALQWNSIRPNTIEIFHVFLSFYLAFYDNYDNWLKA